MAIDVRVHADAESLATAAAAAVVDAARRAFEARGAFALALAGGSTPRRTYERLAEHHARDIPWERVEIFFGDERCVPPHDEQSNFAMAWVALLSRVPVASQNVHPMYLGAELPEVAAARYDALLRRRFEVAGGQAPRTFDLLLLGVGDDGHTASLFPGAPSLEERARWALAVDAPPGVATRHRVTLTLPAIAASRTVMVLCAGAAKRRVVSEILSDDAASNAPRHPAGMARGVDETIWMCDEAAAGRA